MRKTKLVALLLAVALVASMVVPGVAAEGVYTVSIVDAETQAATIEANAGDEICLNVVLSNNPGISSIAVEVSYPEDWKGNGGWEEELFKSAAYNFMESETVETNPYYLNWLMPTGTKKSASDRVGKKLSFENGSLYTLFLEIPADAVSGEF